jgi:hypothetical protein
MAYRGNPIKTAIYVNNPMDMSNNPEPHQKKYTWFCLICNKEYTFKAQAQLCETEHDKILHPEKYISKHTIEGTIIALMRSKSQNYYKVYTSKMHEYISMKGTDYVISVWENYFSSIKNWDCPDDRDIENSKKYIQMEIEIFGKTLTPFKYISDNMV